MTTAMTEGDDQAPGLAVAVAADRMYDHNLLI
jgi:hypothetical protein